MTTQRLKLSCVLALAYLAFDATSWAQVFGSPDMLETIQSISMDFDEFDGSSGDYPAFRSAIPDETMFAPPINLDEVGEGSNLGTAQFGSGWFVVNQLLIRP